MRALTWLSRGLAAAGRAAVRGLAIAYHWLVDHVTRVLALLWLAGMAVVLVTTLRRAVRQPHEEGARVATAAHVNGDGPVQVLQMMDVDEMTDIQNQRMHALGLAAAGDAADPDQAAIDAARAARGKASDAGGDQVGGGGNIVVVSKGGIAGWIKRNKGKRPDPETLAWLRGEEKAEGRAAYAGWADSGDGDLMSWLKKNKGARGAEPSADTRQAIAEAGAGSAGSATPSPSPSLSPSPSPSPSPLPSPSPSPSPLPSPSPPAPAVDLYALGLGAVVALSPAAAVAEREATLAALRAALAAGPAWRAAAPEVRGRQIVIALPTAAFGADAALTVDGRVGARALGAALAKLRGGDVEIRGAADAALELASELVIGGADPEHLALAAGSDAAPIEVVVLEAR